MRADHADGFVQHQHHAGRRIQRFAIHAYGVVVKASARTKRLAVGIDDTAIGKQARDFAATAIAEIGKMAHQLHRRASITLKPSRSTWMRACAKCSRSVS